MRRSGIHILCSRRRLALACVLALPIVGVTLGAAEATSAAAPRSPSRTISFSGYTWTVKTSGRERFGPGPNYFSDSADNVWVDEEGRLHLRITSAGGRWYSAEVVNTESLGYGTYRFKLASPVDADALDPEAILGLFTYSDDPAFANREIDIEFGKWGKRAETATGSWTVQPYTLPGTKARFVQPAAASTTQAFTWRPHAIAFANAQGSWTYAGSAVPPAGDERVRMNLWLDKGRVPANGVPIEVVVERFTFTPLAGHRAE